jgi:hypothetical protein
VSKIITLVSNILEEEARNEIKMPAGVLEIHQTMSDFHAVAGFPRIIGAIDGTHPTVCLSPTVLWVRGISDCRYRLN